MSSPHDFPAHVERGNVYSCSRCERSYRFRAHPQGQQVHVHEKRYFWSRAPEWRALPAIWPSTLTKFRCRCGAPLLIR